MIPRKCCERLLQCLYLEVDLTPYSFINKEKAFCGGGSRFFETLLGLIEGHVINKWIVPGVQCAPCFLISGSDARNSQERKLSKT